MAKQYRQFDNGLFLPDLMPRWSLPWRPRRFMFTPGCEGAGCCESQPCTACLLSGDHFRPDSCEVVISGITNNGCDTCVSLNGTYICNYDYTTLGPSDACAEFWGYDFEGGCNTTKLVVKVLFMSTQRYVYVIFTGGSAVGAWQYLEATPAEPFACDEIDLDLTPVGVNQDACYYIAESACHVTF
jgi:hypothetical protein